MVEAKRPNQEAKKQTDHNADISKMDTIYRQAAIDAMCAACWDWCDEGVCKKVSAIQKLPSAQPEIIRCNDCKYYISYTPYGLTLGFCNRLGFQAMELDDFCSRAERRSDG